MLHMPLLSVSVNIFLEDVSRKLRVPVKSSDEITSRFQGQDLHDLLLCDLDTIFLCPLLSAKCIAILWTMKLLLHYYYCDMFAG